MGRIPLSMNDENTLLILKLSSLLNKLRLRELALARARYKVAYLRKIRSAISANKVDNLPDGFNKWKNDPTGLEKAIEAARLKVLKIQHKNVTQEKRARQMVSSAAKAAGSTLVFKGGKIVGFTVGSLPEKRVVFADKFSEMADQYEATMAMNKVLLGKG